MDKIKGRNCEGSKKMITGPDEQGYVFKYFKKNIEEELYSFEEQQKILNKKKQYFGKFIPETELVEDGNGNYHIKQKFIKGKLLKYTNIKTLPQKALFNLLELIKLYIHYAREEGVTPDTIGYQEDLIEIDNIWKRKIFVYLRFYRGFIASSNIIVADNGEVYMVDICETISLESKNIMINNIKVLIRNFLINMGIKNTMRRLNGLIKEKEAELHETLSMKEG